MKIAIVSPYPPSKGTLNEYAYHLVKNFVRKEDVTEIVILTDRIEEKYPDTIEENGTSFKIIPCWTFNGFGTVSSILTTLRQEKPDVVLYNIQFLSFGDNKVVAALGLLLPLLSRMMGIPAITLLHNITETVDYKSAKITDSKLLQKAYGVIGTVLTKLLLFSNLLVVTMPKYVRILEKKYGAKNVALIPHGTFDVVPPAPEVESETTSVMTFGKFGTYKKVEEMIEAIELVRERTGQQIEIVIAGSDNPNALGYLENVKKKYAHVSNVTYWGYVEEEDVPDLFINSTVVVFPYTSTTGSSGVLHQAGSFAKAVVLPNIGDLKELIEEEGYQGAFFKPSSVESMADAIESLILDSEYRRQMGEANYAAAASLPMSDIVEWYLMHFEKYITKKRESSPNRPVYQPVIVVGAKS